MQIQDRHSQAMSSAAIVVSGRIEVGQTEGGGKKTPDLPNLELLFSQPPCLALRGRKDRKDIDRFVDCDRKRALSVTCCAGSVCL